MYADEFSTGFFVWFKAVNCFTSLLVTKTTTILSHLLKASVLHAFITCFSSAYFSSSSFSHLGQADSILVETSCIISSLNYKISRPHLAPEPLWLLPFHVLSFTGKSSRGWSLRLTLLSYISPHLLSPIQSLSERLAHYNSCWVLITSGPRSKTQAQAQGGKEWERTGGPSCPGTPGLCPESLLCPVTSFP